jgi:hypothetical protein
VLSSYQLLEVVAIGHLDGLQLLDLLLPVLHVGCCGVLVELSLHP